MANQQGAAPVKTATAFPLRQSGLFAAVAVLRWALLAMVLTAGATPALAEDPLILTGPYHFRSNTGRNDYGLLAGDWQHLGVWVSHSDLPTTVTATQGGTVLPLSFVPAPLAADIYEIVFPFDAALIGPFTITATRGAESVTVVSPGMPAAILVPQLENLGVVNPIADPTLTWLWPDLSAAAAHQLALTVRIVATDDAHRDEFELNWGFTDHPIVIGAPGETFAIRIPPGILETDALFRFKAVIDMLDADGRLVSRSVTFARNLFTAP